jgi:hypothetical protein
VSAEESQRRQAELQKFYESGTLPPLYWTSEVDQSEIRRGSIRGSGLVSHFLRESSEHSERRQEIHTIEQGTAEALVQEVWRQRFGDMPLTAVTESRITVGVDDETPRAASIWMTPVGWAVLVATSTHDVVVFGTGAIPDTVRLTRVTLRASG